MALVPEVVFAPLVYHRCGEFSLLWVDFCIGYAKGGAARHISPHKY